VVNGDVPDNDAAGASMPGGGGDEEQAWLDLIARFGTPAPPDDGAVPWPERENVTEREDLTEPAQAPPQPGIALSAGQGPRDVPAPAGPDEDHYVPPPPPPLPRLGVVTKFAWLALFGGPCYLLIATAAGWTVSGLAAFLAVAAFVGGFAVLVLRMDNGGPRDSGPDDGAVV
jgi:hypothetical protein